MEGRRNRRRFELAFCGTTFIFDRFYDLQFSRGKLDIYDHQRHFDDQQFYRHLLVYIFLEKERKKRLNRFGLHIFIESRPKTGYY